MSTTRPTGSEGRARPPAAPRSTIELHARLGQRPRPGCKLSCAVTLAVLAAPLLPHARGAREAAPEFLWETPGFHAPESVVFDAVRGEFYVSNMGTHGRGQVDGDGFISRVGEDGALLARTWVNGLHNPKGLALVGDRLFVGDDDALVEIDVAAGAIVARHAPDDGPGAFNDCTADPAGRVYVFSSRRSAVFRLDRDGTFEAWVSFDTSGTGYINGLLAERDRLLLGGWSYRDAAGVEHRGHISTIDLATKAVGRLGTTPVAHVDGLEPDGAGGYLVTDYVTGAVVRVSAAGEVAPCMTLPAGVADHTHVIARKLIVFPLVKSDALRAYRWSPDATDE